MQVINVYPVRISICEGYAWSGGGRPVVRVDISADGGKNWTVANLDEQEPHCVSAYSGCWSWTLWSARVPVPKGSKTVELIVKAVDSAYNTQPEKMDGIWNFRGVLSNAYHRVLIKLKT